MKRRADGGRWGLLALVTGAHTASAMSVLAVAPLAPLLRDDLGLTRAQIGLFLALFARENLGMSVVAAGGLLAAAQAGGTLGRIGWGVVSDRLFGGRRRPGLIINSLLGAAACLFFASGAVLPGPMVVVTAIIAGIGTFGWVGLYLALAAEVGGTRHAGLLTGVAVACSWNGVLVGPPLFGLLLDATGSYHWPWLALAVTGVAAAVALHRIPPLVKRP